MFFQVSNINMTFVTGMLPAHGPWCATAVNADKHITEVGLCQDERKLIFANKGEGTFCPFPFEFNGIRSVLYWDNPWGFLRRKRGGDIHI